MGGHEIDHLPTFSILAELALGLAGFTGVAAAFGGRDRVFEYTDQIRLLGIFLAAGSVLAGCLTVLSFGTAGQVSSSAYLWASLLALLIIVPNAYPLIPHTFGFWRDPDIRTQWWVFAIVVTQFVICLVLLVGNAVVWVSPTPLVTAFSVQLMYGLFLFARILTVRK